MNGCLANNNSNHTIVTRQQLSADRAVINPPGTFPVSHFEWNSKMSYTVPEWNTLNNVLSLELGE